jgi:toluene monooxygenase electron transfer component
MRIQVKSRTRFHQFDAGPGEKILFSGLCGGIALPYECATGTCGTCRARLIEGEIEDRWSAAPGRKVFTTGQNEFLMCQCIARSDVALEVARAVEVLDPAARPRRMTGVVSELRMLTADVIAIDVRLDACLDFEAGQFMAVAAPGLAGMRSYSMVNYARGTERLEFLIKKKPGGGFSEWLFGGNAPGAKLELFGPLGKATFSPRAEKNILCVAGGSGIAGMMSILTHASEERHFDRFPGHVFFGVRTLKDAFYLNELSSFSRGNPDRLSITVALSDEDVPEAAAAQFPQLRFARGFVHEVARRDMAGKYGNVRAYVAGPPPAVDATLRVLLLDARLSAENIRYDKFS